MAVVVTEPRTVLIDSSGTPYPRAKRYLYAAGTSTPLTVYSDPALTTAHAVPQEADSQGFFAPAYLPGSVTSYRRVIQTSAGVSGGTRPAAAIERLQARRMGRPARPTRQR